MGGAARHTSCRCFCPAGEKEANKKRKMEEKGRGTVRDVREGERTRRRDRVVTDRGVCGGQVKSDTDGIRAGEEAQAALRSVIQQFSDRDKGRGGSRRQRGPVGWGRGLAPKAMKY